MPLFKVNIDREVTNYDRFIRVVEAPTPEEATQIAKRIAEASNDETPDDLYTSWFDDEFGSWFVNDVEPADDSDVTEYGIVDPTEYPEEVG